MRNLLAGAMMIIMALSILVAVILFGAVSIDLAAPVYGLVILLVVLWAAKLFLAKVVSWKQSPAHLPVLAFLIYVVVRYFT